MKRRDFVAGLAGAVTWPIAAQRRSKPVIGFSLRCNA
jgi:hypothetical protein